MLKALNKVFDKSLSPNIHSDINERYSTYMVISDTDTRNSKGYKFEMNGGQDISEIPSIKYEGNPTNYGDWLHEHNKNKYDGIITLPNGKTKTLEFKYRACKKVYHSWFVECWLPRDADIFVTNNTQVISYSDKRLLDAKHQKVMSPSEVEVNLGRLVRNCLHPRKYLYFNRVLTNISRISTITDGFFSYGLGVFKEYFTKFKSELRYLCMDSLHVKTKINSKRGLDKMKCKYKEVKRFR